MKRFSLPDGSPFARLLDTGIGQILVTLTANKDGNPELSFARWSGGDVVEVSIGLTGIRTDVSDEKFIRILAELTPARAEATWREALDP